MTTVAPLPALGIIEAALRKTTEVLASELAQPTALEPGWSDFEWLMARAVATIHGVSPLLSSRLAWSGPMGWRQFLDEQRVQTASRHRRIQQLLQLIDECARGERIPVLALKGAALHAAGLYDPGERPMADVDLLVREADMQSAIRILQVLGFRQSSVYWKHLEFTPTNAKRAQSFGEHSDSDMKIELHDRIAEILPLRRTDITELLFPRLPRPGLNSYPSSAALMAHLLLHAAGAMAYRSLRMLNLHDIALLARRMTIGDWDHVLKMGDDLGGPWWAVPPLALTARYYSSAIPAAVLSTLTPACRRSLCRLARHGRLSDVSLSYLWIEAFPGLRWARSVDEMLEYVGGRTLRAATLLLRRSAASGENTAPIGSDAAQFSRAPYILRWFISRQARPETMQAVRAVLEQGA